MRTLLRPRLVAAAATIAAALLVAGACTLPPQPPPADPLLTCTTLGGDLSYTPPPEGDGQDVTVDTLPGFALSGCTDHTGGGISGASMQASVFWPDFLCSSIPPLGTQLAAGDGVFQWSDGSSSTFDIVVLSNGGQGGFIGEMTFTGGRWAGARASFVEEVVAATGQCIPGVGLMTTTMALRDELVLRPPRPAASAPLTNVVEVSAGGNHTCARLVGGGIRCWGFNSDGQLGSILFGPGSQTSVPVEVTGISDAVQVSAGSAHTCAVASGGVLCWGDNQYGQLGIGSTTDWSVPVPVAGISGATRVAAGSSHTCAIVAGGEVRCWGANGGGQLGDGSFVDSNVPVAVTGISGATKIVVGQGHSCALVSGGDVSCWGGNNAGQLGDGTTVNRAEPVTVPSSSGGPSIDLAAGGWHTCDLQAGFGGVVRCWGYNRYGQLGSGVPGDTPVTSPVWMSVGLGVDSLNVDGVTSCALLGAGVSCWGGGEHGERGDGTEPYASISPSVAFGLRDAESVDAGGSHVCAVVPGGQVRCWGYNGQGQLGDTSLRDSAMPVAVVSVF